jgi:hypothetical protein
MHLALSNYFYYFLAAMAVGLVGMNLLREHARRDREAFERAVPGSARVLKIGTTTPSRSYGTVLMDLLIQIRRNGVEPYEVSMIWSVQPGSVSKVKVGETLAVKVDPLDRTRIFSAEPWAHSLGVKKTPVE